MFSVKIPLKQHTPLIHFQHEQEGATLRATELKPKLDRFIITKIGNGNFEDGCKIAAQKEWLKEDSEHFSLDYKVRIEASVPKMNTLIEEIKYDNRTRQIQFGNNNLPKTISFPTFFGNMGLDIRDEKKLKKFVFHEKVNINLFTFCDDLLEFIEKEIGNFFFLHNFGNRQSKGFGSFYPVDFKKYPNTIKTYSFELTINGNSLKDKFTNLFSDINLLYSTLKSGINFKNTNGETVFYFKSLLFKYVEAKYKVQWDKKTIKEGLILEKQVGDSHILFRDLLGLSSEQEWLSYRVKITKECASLDTNNKPIITRYKSPIMIKPLDIGNNKIKIFIIAESIDSEYLANGRFAVKNEKTRKTINLTLPSSFDIHDFLKFAFKVDIEDHIDYDFEKHSHYSKINSIYKHLKQSISYA